MLEDASLPQARLSPSLLAFCSLVHRYSPFPLIQMHTQFRSDVSLASTLDEYSQLLCYLFVPYTRLLRPGDGSQEPDDTTDDYYYPEGSYYYVMAADDLEQLGGSQAGGIAFSIDVPFVLAFLRQTCLTYVCTQILLLPLTLVFSSLCIRALEAPGL